MKRKAPGPGHPCVSPAVCWDLEPYLTPPWLAFFIRGRGAGRGDSRRLTGLSQGGCPKRVRLPSCCGLGRRRGDRSVPCPVSVRALPTAGDGKPITNWLKKRGTYQHCNHEARRASSWFVQGIKPQGPVPTAPLSPVTSGSASCLPVITWLQQQVEVWESVSFPTSRQRP